MKGVIFAIFEDFVVEDFGADTFEDLLDDCPHTAKGRLIGPISYPDQWLVDLVAANRQAH